MWLMMRRQLADLREQVSLPLSGRRYIEPTSKQATQPESSLNRKCYDAQEVSRTLVQLSL